MLNLSAIASNLPVGLFLIPFFASLLAVCAAVTSRYVARAIAYVGLTGLVALSIYAFITVLGTEGHKIVTPLGKWTGPLGIEWALDPFAAFMMLVIAIGAWVVLIFGQPAINREFGSKETYFWGTALLFVTGLIGMVMTNDLFNMFVHLEVASISSYAMVAAGKKGGPRAAMKYLLLGSIGASGYLLGVGFIYAATGSLNMTDVAQILNGAAADRPEVNVNLIFIGIVLIILGFAVKMGMFPFHAWMPAAYSKSPLICAALMAPLATKVSAYALIKVLYVVWGPANLLDYDFMMHALIFFGGIGMIVGGFFALVQKDLKRLLAYSSVSQVCLVAIGIGLANTNALNGAIIHLANDAIMKAAFFLLAGVIFYRFGIKNVDDLAILRGRAPVSMTIIMITSLSLAGLPPLCGFWGKWYVLTGAVEANQWHAVVLIIIGSLASIAYVFRIWERMLYQPKVENVTVAEKSNDTYIMLGAAGVLTIGMVALGLWIEPVIDYLSVYVVEGFLMAGEVKS